MCDAGMRVMMIIRIRNRVTVAKGEGKIKSKNGCQNESGKWEKGESEGNQAN